jgi:signal transduction histidine kinase
MGDRGAIATMDRRARLLLPTAFVLFAASAVVLVLQGSALMKGVILTEGAKLAIGALIFVRKPGNVVGMLLVIIGAGFAVTFGLDVLATSFVESGRVDIASWIVYLFGPFSLLFIVLQSAILLLFPHGRFSSSGDRRFMWGVSIYFAAFVVFSVFASPSSLTDPTAEALPHPFITASWTADLSELAFPLGGVLILSFLVAAVRLVMRSRRVGTVERHQIRWVGLGCAIYWVTGMTNAVLDPFGAFEAGFQLADSVMSLVIPVTIAVAIFRHRLYDIDVIVSKSVTYLGLAASITLLYAAVVVGPLLMIGVGDDGGGPGLFLPIVATGAVALLFEPIRTRLQRWANRLVYGDRATPQEVLSRVTARLSDTAGGNGTQDLARLLAEGTGAERVVVWSRSHDGLRPEAIHPLDRSDAVETVPVDGLVDGEFTESRAVLHQGVLYGALSITKARNDPITPDDRELLSDVAAGAGLLLRNISLNRELEERAEEVRASRRRLIAAQDAERHRLERDLHDGAQQQVVALKVKLGIARTIAEREGTDEIAARVSALAEETQQAVDALRAVAHGIYPPLLEAEGLESALRAVERTSSIPLVLDVEGITRYPRSIEETVYFSVLDTVERARMSGAREVEARLAGVDGELLIEVGLDGVTEIDLTAVSDRIDASGGMLRIDQTDGGTALTARLPVLDSTVLASSPSDLVSEPS